MQKLSTTVLLVFLAFTLVSCSQQTPTNLDTTALEAGATYTLAAKHSNLNLDVPSSQTRNGLALQQYTPNGTTAQQFMLKDAGNGTWKLINKASGKALEIDDGNKTNGSPVQQWDEANVPWQVWSFIDKGNGYYLVKNAYTGLVMDVAEASTKSGAKVYQWTEHGEANQLWKLIKVGSGSPAPQPEPTPQPTPEPQPTPTPNGSVIFGANDGTGYDKSRDFNVRVSAELQRLGLKAARTGMNGAGCERVGVPCNFADTDVVVEEHLKRGVALHMVIAFRSELDKGSNVQEWARNYGWKCGQFAEHYQGRINYYIVDNEADLDYDFGPKVPASTTVAMQKACYEAIKAVDASILVESSPATSPTTDYNREMLRLGIGNYADIIGTHMYGGQLAQDAIGTLQGYMNEFGVNKPIACSECGSSVAWFTDGPCDDCRGESWKGLKGQAAQAQWLRDFAVYAREKKLHNVLFFSMFSVHGDNWELNTNPQAMEALYDIGHGQF